jgi:two-component sensor histidine kinase
VNSGLTYDESGKPVGLHVVARDVTEKKRAEEHQELLINELNHRVKNSLAVVQSIAEQTLRSGDVPDEVRQALSGRLAALASAHNVVTREKWASASMRQIISDVVQPFCSNDRCIIEGPDLPITPTTAATLGLAVHELATNAAKYGALKGERGSVNIHWGVDESGLSWEWRESGGPRVSPPSRRGFGTKMIERALARQLGGTVSLEFLPDGLRCRVTAPAPAGV